MAYRRFPPHLCNAVVLHYAHLWHSAKCLDEAAVGLEQSAPLNPTRASAGL